MKKILQYFILTIMTVCFSVPAFSSAEAATVALLPLVNNVKGDELAGQIFYQEAIGTLNDYPEYMMIENDKLTAAMEKSHITDVTDEAALHAQAASACPTSMSSPLHVCAPRCAPYCRNSVSAGL